jgi:hypothetical protein
MASHLPYPAAEAMPVIPAAEPLADHLKLLGDTLSEDPTMVVLVAAAAVVIVALLGKVHELRDRRAAEAIAVQGEIADALLRDPALLGLPLVPRARVPLWRGSPVTVKVTGEVPSRELRALALRAAERGTEDLLVRVRIKSRIGVVKPRRRRRYVMPAGQDPR